MYEVVMKKL